MVGVLHLMTHDADLQAVRTSQALSRVTSEMEVTVRKIGGGGYYRDAVQAALSLRFGRGKLFDVIHAFDLSSLAAACCAPSAVVYGPSQPPGGSIPWLRAAMVYKNATAIATSAAMKAAMIRGNIPASRCEVIAPIMDSDHTPSLSRQATRSLLGIEPQDRVILTPGESVRSAAHALALHVASILHVFDPRYRLLVWGRGSSVGALSRLAAGLRQPGLLIAAESLAIRPLEFEELIPAADIALVTAPRFPAPLPLMLCMSGGLPIVGVATPALREFVADPASVDRVPNPSPRLLAKSIIDLFEEPSRLAHARPIRFDPTRAIQRHIALYRRAAGMARNQAV